MLVQGCGLVVLVQGAHERLLEAEEFLGSFFLAARAPDTVGHVQGLRALGPGHHLGEEVAKALPKQRRPCRTEGEAARGTVEGSHLRR